MLLTFPHTTQPILIESQLEPISEDISDLSVRRSTGQGTKQVVQGALRDMPIVSIRHPNPAEFKISVLPKSCHA